MKELPTLVNATGKLRPQPSCEDARAHACPQPGMADEGRRALTRSEEQRLLRWSRRSTDSLRGSIADCCAGAMNATRHPCCASSLPPLQRHLVRRGLMEGDLLRLGRLSLKLVAGKACTIVVLGSSLAASPFAGCSNAAIHANQHAGHCSHGNGWARMYVDWLNAVWPPTTAESHTLYAFGQTGSGAAAFADCFQASTSAVCERALTLDVFMSSVAVNSVLDQL